MQNNDREHMKTGPEDAGDAAAKSQDLDRRIEQALADAPAPDSASPEPPVQQMLAGAYARAAAQAMEPALRRRRWLLAGGGLVVVAVVAAVLVFWPLRFERDGGGVALDRASAWAATAGYVIDVDVVQVPPTEEQLAALAPNLLDDLERIVDLTDGQVESLGLNAFPGLVFYRALARWNRAHTRPDGGPLLNSTQLPDQHSQFTHAGGGLITSTALVLLSDDPQLRDSVLALLDTLPGLSPPRVYTETLYLNEKYPDIYTPARQVIVDGRALRFPFEVDAQYVKPLHTMFTLLDHDLEYYRAYWLVLNRKSGSGPLATGDVLKISFNDRDDMLIETVAESWNPPGEHVPVSMSVDPQDLPPDFDVLAELEKRMERRVARAAGEPGDGTPRYSLTVELLPLERMTAPADERVTEAELARTRQAFAEIQQAFSAWYAGIDEFHDPLRLDRRARLRSPTRFGDGVASVTATLITDDSGQLEELRRLLRQASGGITPAVASGNLTVLEPPLPGYVVEYQQLYQRTGSSHVGADARHRFSATLTTWLDDCNSAVDRDDRRITLGQWRDTDLWHGWHKCTAVLYFPGRNQALIDGLTARLAEVPGVVGPAVTARDLFYSPVNPQPFLPGRQVVIDGVEYDFPRDFTTAEWSELTVAITGLGRQTWYRANWRLGETGGAAGESAHPFGEVVALHLDDHGDLVIDTLAADYVALVAARVEQGLAEPLAEGALARNVEVRIAPDGPSAGCDPLALLIEKSRMADDGRPAIRGGDQPFYRIKLPLFPTARWTATGEECLGPADMARAGEMQAGMRAAFNQWFAGQPQLHGDEVVRPGAALAFCEIGGVPFCANLQLFTADPALKDELVAMLVDAGSGLEPLAESYPAP